jgi:hypothetical protein
MDAYGKANGHTMNGELHVPRPSFPSPPRRTSPPAPPSRPPTTPPSSRPSTSRAGYGIRRAVELLRRLPPGERAVLVDVVKMTLESLNVQVDTIVDDATRREGEIDKRIAMLREEVSEREEQIATRRDEIRQLEVEQEEIARVKEQLTAARERAERQDAETSEHLLTEVPANEIPAESDELGQFLAAIENK